MIQQQIDRRRRRGREDVDRIVNRGNHPVYGPFDVTSRSGRTYRVTIRDLRERRNACTCPDYRTNLVGTCKHIEGVLAELRQTYRDALDELAAERPPATPVYLHYERDVSVRTGPPAPSSRAAKELFERAFDADGVLPGPLLYTLPGLLREIDRLPERHRTAIAVDAEVHDYLGVLRDRDAARRQRSWFEAQVRAGRRSLDLLAHPLYRYQQEGALHLAFGRRALLADDMGLGKTIETVAAAALLHQLRDIRRVLVICPASLKEQWAREIRRFTSFDAAVVEGPPESRRDRYASPAFFTIVNYELVLRDEAAIAAMRPDVIVLDEAQRIKNWRSKTANVVKRLDSPYGFVLTGTPLENRLDELYSVFQFIDPRILGPLWHFNERYFAVDEVRPGRFRVLGYRNLEELRSRIEPHVLRRTRAQVLDALPSRTDNHYFVEMTAEQTGAYEEYQATAARLLSIARRRPLSPREQKILLGALVKMRVICNALALHDRTLDGRARERTAPKLRELREILHDVVVRGDRKALVFSQWAGMLDLVEPVLKRLGLGHVKLTGSVPSSRRGALVQAFAQDADVRVFLSTDAGGLGLNLQAASVVINLDLPWNPATLEQRVGRAHRHGQSRAVQVINLIARGTIEERILDTLATKRTVFDGIFGAETPEEVAFEDTGQQFLRDLDEMLRAPDEGPTAATDGPARPPAITGPRQQDARPRGPERRPDPRIAVPDHRPGLRAFAETVVARFPGRIQLVRRAQGARGTSSGVLVVVDRDPSRLRRPIQELVDQTWPEDAPCLRLMDREGYDVLVSMVGGLPPLEAEEEPYRAPALQSDRPEPAEERRRVGLDALSRADRSLRLAEVVLAGGFPEEAARPAREAIAWALGAMLTTAGTGPGAVSPGPVPPPARVVQARLIEPGRLTRDLAARIAHALALTSAGPTPAEADAPAAAASGEGGGGVGPLSEAAARDVVDAVAALLEHARAGVVRDAVSSSGS